MKTNAVRLITFTVLTLALTACGKSTITIRSLDGETTVSVKVEVADSPQEHEQGLMGRTAMDEGTGMLFAFKNPQMLQFWMKDTKIPLDIFFFDEQGNFVSYAAMEPCTEEPCTVYKSAALSSYALEVNKGFRDEHKVGVGWSLDLDQVRKIARPT